MSKITLADVTTAKILGHLIGDGGVSPIFNKMYFTNSNIKLIKEYCSFLKRRNIPFSLIKQENYIIVVTYRKKYVLEFLNYGGCKSKDKYVPPSVINSTKKIKIAVLDSLLKDEGRRVSVNRIQFATTKKKFMDSFIQLLKSLKIKIKRSYTYKRENFTQYIITISREDLKKYGINYWDKMPVPKAKNSLLAV